MQNGKSEKGNWILRITISLGTKFNFKLTIFIFWTKFSQKRYFRSKTEKLQKTKKSEKSCVLRPYLLYQTFFAPELTYTRVFECLFLFSSRDNKAIPRKSLTNYASFSNSYYLKENVWNSSSIINGSWKTLKRIRVFTPRKWSLTRVLVILTFNQHNVGYLVTLIQACNFSGFLKFFCRIIYFEIHVKVSTKSRETYYLHFCFIE